MTDIDSSPEVLRRLAEIVSEHGLAQLEVEQDGLRIRIKGISDTVPGVAHAYVAAPAAAVSAPPAAAHTAAPSAPAANPRAHLLALESPMVGTFYRAATPEDPPFIKPGDVVTIGQTIGLIEAMKVYSEVPAEVGGRVVEVVVENGKLVQMGQPLAYVEPL